MTDTLQAMRAARNRINKIICGCMTRGMSSEATTDEVWEYLTVNSLLTTPQAAQEEVVERVNAFEVAIREHMRSYGSSFSVIDRYAAQVKQKREALIATLTPPSQPTAKEAVNA